MRGNTSSDGDDLVAGLVRVYGGDCCKMYMTEYVFAGEASTILTIGLGTKKLPDTLLSSVPSSSNHDTFQSSTKAFSEKNHSEFVLILKKERNKETKKERNKQTTTTTNKQQQQTE